jgi:hypothetical protein
MDGKEGKDHGEFDTVCVEAGRELVGDLQTVRESDPFIGCPGKKKMFASAREAFDEHLRPSTPLPACELVLARRLKRAKYSASCTWCQEQYGGASRTTHSSRK